MNARAGVLYTVGHSTRTLDELAATLAPAAVRELIDVRSVSHSRRHPQFDSAALERSLPERGVAYAHERALGGFRRPVPGSPNGGWENDAFRGYADHMASEEFRAALRRVQERAREQVVCVMCAEAQWWRCHRRLLADALVVAGFDVLHLGLGREPLAHELTSFAVLGEDGSLSYPPAQAELELGA
ncbi:MAG TPA: DUF488 domain-containing protein [Solirubrobacteraceae bacterium]|nr:DUF488 domain-containing protein [Solirubrobacteraceae bacterium]